jgi:hypothetical protein
MSQRQLQMGGYARGKQNVQEDFEVRCRHAGQSKRPILARSICRDSRLLRHREHVAKDLAGLEIAGIDFEHPVVDLKPELR